MTALPESEERTPTPQLLATGAAHARMILPHSGPLMTIHNPDTGVRLVSIERDGSVTVANESDASEAAKTFWGVLRIEGRTLMDELTRLRASLAEAEQDSRRLDYMSSLVGDVDQTICSPGNHGGGAGNWLLTIEENTLPCKFHEFEGLTLREAIDAALHTAEDTP